MTTTEKTTGFFETSDRAQIYYESRGHGEPVIFVYGIACLLNHWHHQIHYFAPDYQVIAYDLRGHHQSTAGEDSSRLTVKGMGQDLIELMDHLKLQKAHAVGHSFGAPVLLSGHHQDPNRFRSLTFINGFDKNPIKGMFGLDVIERVFHLAKNAHAANPDLFSSLWKMAIDNPLSIFLSGLAGGFNLQLTQLKDIEVYARGVAHLNLSVFIPLFEDMMNFDGEALAREIQVPTLIMAGDRDFVTPYKFQEALHESIRGSTLVRLPYGSHCCQLDFPDYVNLRLEKHLKMKQLISRT